MTWCPRRERLFGQIGASSDLDKGISLKQIEYLYLLIITACFTFKGHATNQHNSNNKSSLSPSQHLVSVQHPPPSVPCNLSQTSKPTLSLLHKQSETFQPPTLGLYVFNAASLAKPNALQQLTANINGYGIDIAVISETHFKSKHTDNLFKIEGYQLFRRDRPERKGGGVAVYIR